ncbi:MAG: lyase family protein, partial [Chloroflexota bacterium]
MTTKLWAGRFQKPTDRLVEAFTASIQVDQRLARHDIVGSMGHARMLGRQGIIPAEDARSVAAGLAQVWSDLQSGHSTFSPELEDVHMNVETLLGAKIGPVAGRLHTARSRNDQVATDIRLYFKEAAQATVSAIRALQSTLLDLAGNHLHTVFPGYTHLQRAQPVVLAHHLLAYFHMLQRDLGRFHDCLKR